MKKRLKEVIRSKLPNQSYLSEIEVVEIDSLTVVLFEVGETNPTSNQLAFSLNSLREKFLKGKRVEFVERTPGIVDSTISIPTKYHLVELFKRGILLSNYAHYLGSSETEVLERLFRKRVAEEISI